MNDRKKILEVKNIKKYFQIGNKESLKALDDISLSLDKGEFLGIVGESGSGKSTLGRCIIKINEIDSGKIIYDNLDISTNKFYKKHKDIITSEMQIIFQDSISCLNARKNTFEIISEPLRIKKMYKDKKELLNKVIEIMKEVGLTKEDLFKYPSEFSGGQRQRIGIARAIISNPKLIIADEPIASLDVSMQAQIINLFKKLKQDKNLSCIFIAHDLSMVKYISDRIAVMYKGKIVELGEAEEICDNPIHPYTKLLLNSKLIADPKFKNLSLMSAYDENDIEFKFSESKFIEIKKNHYVYKVLK